MRILHVVQSLDPEWGGIAHVLPNLARELVRAGNTCRIAALTGGRFGDAPEIAGVEVLRFPGREGGLGKSPEFDRKIPELVAESDVVHLHGLWTAQNRSASREARRQHKPYIMTPHSMMMPWAWKRSWWKKRPIGWLFEHRNLRGASFLHALARGEAEHMCALGFNPRIEVIPNGIYVDEYRDPPSPDAMHARFPELAGKRWLLFLGRIHPQKGIIQALQAAFDVLALGNEWQFIIAGPDPLRLRPMLEAGIDRKGAKGCVTFTGMLNREEVRIILGRTKLLIQPSESEGLSMSILEAMASGVPVLISTQCNMPEVETADAGRIVEPSRRAIRGALRTMVGMEDGALEAMGARGREFVRLHYDWVRLLPEYQRLYEKARG